MQERPVNLTNNERLKQVIANVDGLRAAIAAADNNASDANIVEVAVLALQQYKKKTPGTQSGAAGTEFSLPGQVPGSILYPEFFETIHEIIGQLASKTNRETRYNVLQLAIETLEVTAKGIISDPSKTDKKLEAERHVRVERLISATLPTLDSLPDAIMSTDARRTTLDQQMKFVEQILLLEAGGHIPDTVLPKPARQKIKTFVDQNMNAYRAVDSTRAKRIEDLVSGKPKAKRKVVNPNRTSNGQEAQSR